MSVNSAPVWQGGALSWWTNEIMKAKGDLNAINTWNAVNRFPWRSPESKNNGLDEMAFVSICQWTLSEKKKILSEHVH